MRPSENVEDTHGLAESPECTRRVWLKFDRCLELSSVDLRVLVKLIQERSWRGRMVFYPFFRDENMRRVLIRDIIILIGGC